MRVYDLRYISDLSSFETDVCVVGSGPAGMTLASELAAAPNVRVLVIESGGLNEEADIQALYEIDTNPPRKSDQAQIRSRLLGGSSRIWTGRCAQFDPIDFAERCWVPHSGWPIQPEEMNPFYERAATYLGLLPSVSEDELWTRFESKRPPAIRSRDLTAKYWQFSKGPNGTPVDFSAGLTVPDSVQVLLHATLTRIDLDPTLSRLESLLIQDLHGKSVKVRAKTLVLCAGGIENARLLLSSNHQHKDGLGNSNDLVGRFLMDHTDGAVWQLNQTLANTISSEFGHYWVRRAKGKHTYLHGLGLSAEAQEEHQLLNCHAYLDQFGSEPGDPWTTMRATVGSLRDRDIKAAAGNIGRLAKSSPELLAAVYRRQVNNRPAFVRARRSEIHFIVEQAPDPRSRVTLSEQRDRLSAPLSRVDWRISELEARTVRFMASAVAAEFRQRGLASLAEPDWVQDPAGWGARCTEKAHPTGTTRMANDARQGVVDANCKIHGLEGIYVAGSSVFPTAGAANPTLMIVAMSIRLADHLKASQMRPSVSNVSPSFISARYAGAGREAPDQVRVGIVGAGGRVRDIHIPVLRHLNRNFEIVGFTTNSSSSPSGRRLQSETGLDCYPDVGHLIARRSPQVILVAVQDRRNESVVKSLIDYGIPLLVETPLAWSTTGVKDIASLANARGLSVGVAEQFPFFPIEQLKQKILESGALGDLISAHNDFCSYSYHGVAQLRRYLSSRAIRLSNKVLRDESGKWEEGVVTLKGGAELFINTPIEYAPRRGSIRVYGTRGQMIDDQILIDDKVYSIAREPANDGALKRLSIDLGAAGSFSWSNPYPGLGDEEAAVAAIWENMHDVVKEQKLPIYSPGDFLLDIELVQALRQSRKLGGGVVDLPYREAREKLRAATSIKVWKRRLLTQV